MYSTGMNSALRDTSKEQVNKALSSLNAQLGKVRENAVSGSVAGRPPSMTEVEENVRQFRRSVAELETRRSELSSLHSSTQASLVQLRIEAAEARALAESARQSLLTPEEVSRRRGAAREAEERAAMLSRRLEVLDADIAAEVRRQVGMAASALLTESADQTNARLTEAETRVLMAVNRSDQCFTAVEYLTKRAEEWVPAAAQVKEHASLIAMLRDTVTALEHEIGPAGAGSRLSEEAVRRVSELERRVVAAEVRGRDLSDDAVKRSSESDTRVREMERRALDVERRLAEAEARLREAGDESGRRVAESDARARDGERRLEVLELSIRGAKESAEDACRRALDAESKAREADRRTTDLELGLRGAREAAEEAGRRALDAEAKAREADRRASELERRISRAEDLAKEAVRDATRGGASDDATRRILDLERRLSAAEDQAKDAERKAAAAAELARELGERSSISAAQAARTLEALRSDVARQLTAAEDKLRSDLDALRAAHNDQRTRVASMLSTSDNELEKSVRDARTDIDRLARTANQVPAALDAMATRLADLEREYGSIRIVALRDHALVETTDQAVRAIGNEMRSRLASCDAKSDVADARLTGLEERISAVEARAGGGGAAPASLKSPKAHRDALTSLARRVEELETKANATAVGLTSIVEPRLQALESRPAPGTRVRALASEVEALKGQVSDVEDKVLTIETRGPGGSPLPSPGRPRESHVIISTGEEAFVVKNAIQALEQRLNDLTPIRAALTSLEARLDVIEPAVKSLPSSTNGSNSPIVIRALDSVPVTPGVAAAAQRAAQAPPGSAGGAASPLGLPDEGSMDLEALAAAHLDTTPSSQPSQSKPRGAARGKAAAARESDRTTRSLEGELHAAGHSAAIQALSDKLTAQIRVLEARVAVAEAIAAEATRRASKTETVVGARLSRPVARPASPSSDSREGTELEVEGSIHGEGSVHVASTEPSPRREFRRSQGHPLFSNASNVSVGHPEPSARTVGSVEAPGAAAGARAPSVGGVSLAPEAAAELVERITALEAQAELLREQQPRDGLAESLELEAAEMNSVKLQLASVQARLDEIEVIAAEAGEEAKAAAQAATHTAAQTKVHGHRLEVIEARLAATEDSHAELKSELGALSQGATAPGTPHAGPHAIPTEPGPDGLSLSGTPGQAPRDPSPEIAALRQLAETAAEAAEHALARVDQHFDVEGARAVVLEVCEAHFAKKAAVQALEKRAAESEAALARLGERQAAPQPQPAASVKSVESSVAALEARIAEIEARPGLGAGAAPNAASAAPPAPAAGLVEALKAQVEELAAAIEVLEAGVAQGMGPGAGSAAAQPDAALVARIQELEEAVNDRIQSDLENLHGLASYLTENLHETKSDAEIASASAKRAADEALEGIEALSDRLVAVETRLEALDGLGLEQDQGHGHGHGHSYGQAQAQGSPAQASSVRDAFGDQPTFAAAGPMIPEPSSASAGQRRSGGGGAAAAAAPPASAPQRITHDNSWDTSGELLDFEESDIGQGGAATRVDPFAFASAPTSTAGVTSSQAQGGWTVHTQRMPPSGLPPIIEASATSMDPRNDSMMGNVSVGGSTGGTPRLLDTPNSEGGHAWGQTSQEWDQGPGQAQAQQPRRSEGRRRSSGGSRRASEGEQDILELLP